MNPQSGCFFEDPSLWVGLPVPSLLLLPRMLWTLFVTGVRIPWLRKLHTQSCVLTGSEWEHWPMVRKWVNLFNGIKTVRCIEKKTEFDEQIEPVKSKPLNEIPRIRLTQIGNNGPVSWTLGLLGKTPCSCFLFGGLPLRNLDYIQLGKMKNEKLSFS